MISLGVHFLPQSTVQQVKQFVYCLGTHRWTFPWLLNGCAYSDTQVTNDLINVLMLTLVTVLVMSIVRGIVHSVYMYTAYPPASKSITFREDVEEMSAQTPVKSI